MTTLNPDHLLEQTDRLATPPASGRPRQVDLRRAISAAYYASFHTVLTAAADEIVGAAFRASREHALVMRSIDHPTIKNVCLEISKPNPPARYTSYIPAAGFGPNLRVFAAIFPGLQEERHAADYDSLRRYSTFDTKSVISTGRQAITEFRAAPAVERKALLYILLFPPQTLRAIP